MRIISLVSSLLLVACAGTAPPSHTHYLLRADVPAQTARLEPPVSIGLRRVEVAPYLKQSGLMLATGAHQMRAARYHHWAEPLNAGLRRYLRLEISNALGYDVSADTADRKQWDYAVDVSIDQLHGTVSGQALLTASWRITWGGGADEFARFRLARSEPLAQDGYAGLVDAEIGLARQLAVAIADSLRDIGEEHATHR
jgi:uncharacterized lipoprotein YmbA